MATMYERKARGSTPVATLVLLVCSLMLSLPLRTTATVSEEKICGESFGGETPCLQANATVEIGSNQYRSWTISPVYSGATLDYIFDVVYPPDAHLSSLLLQEDQYNKFLNGTLDILSVNNSGTVHGNQSATVSVRWVARDNGAANQALGKYYLVFLNQDSTNYTVVYTISYTPPKSENCFVVLASVLGSGLIPLMIFGCCVWSQHQKKKTQGVEEETPKSYNYHEPKGFSCLARFGKTIPFFEKQPYGFWIYWANSDDLFWICYPEVGETLSKTQRFIGSATFFFIQLLAQTTWANASVRDQGQGHLTNSTQGEYVEQKSSYIQQIALQIISIATLVTIIGMIYKPFLRCMYRPSPLWHDSEKRRLVLLGKLLNNFGGFIFVIVLVAVVLSVVTLLETFTCKDFLWAIFFPNLLLNVYKSFIPGVFIRWALFKLKNTFGKDVRVQPVFRTYAEEEEGFLGQTDIERSSLISGRS